MKESEVRFRQIYENMAAGVAQVSMDFVIERANSAYCNMLGYNEEELIGKHLKDITHPEILEENLLKQSQLAKGEIDHYRMEKCFIHKNGHIVHGILDANIVRNTEGTPLYFLGVVSDITYLKKVEKELQAEKQLLEGVLDAIKDVVGVQLPDHTMVQYNRAGYELLGLTEDAVKGKKCYELIGRSVPCDVCASSRSHASKKMETLETFIPELDRHFLCTSNPVLDEKGNIKLIIEQLTDITDKKRLDKVLRQSQKMEAIGSLAGGIAHDFNNILFPIVGLSEMMVEDFPEDSTEYQNAKQILTAGKRGSELVKQILAFSRQSEDRRMPVQFQTVLKEVLKLCRSTIPKDIEIHQEIQPDCGFINATPTQLHQIAMNLITNAFHAVEPHHGDISVTLSETELGPADIPTFSLEPGRYVMLTVSDTGSGIDATVIDRIFDPYFTTKDKEKGTGLGLSVVHGIVREYGGDIKVYSEIGQGTTFNVFIPLMEKPADTKTEKTVKNIPTGNERVLLIDDELPIATLEKEMLSRLGYQVTMHTGSVDALETFKETPHSFDLVITDMAMPNMAGDELAKKIMTIRPDIPIIICTGFSERIKPEKVHPLGIKGLLNKPVVQSEMARMVRNVLDEK